MRQIEKLTLALEARFKTLADGREAFYPWGCLGKGWIVPSPDAGREMRKRLKSVLSKRRTVMPICLAIMLTSHLLGILLDFAILPVLIFLLSFAFAMVFFYGYPTFVARHITLDLDPTSERLTYGEQREKYKQLKKDIAASERLQISRVLAQVLVFGLLVVALPLLQNDTLRNRIGVDALTFELSIMLALFLVIVSLRNYLP